MIEVKNREAFNKISSGLIISICLIIYYILGYLPYYNLKLNSIKYLLPLIPLFFIFLFNRFICNRVVMQYFLRNMILYLFIFSISFLVCFFIGFYKRYFIEIFLVFCPLLFAFGLSFFYQKSTQNTYLKIVFWGTIASYLVDKGVEILPVIHHPQLLIDAIKKSTISTESGAGFIFGILFLYYLMENEKKNMFISLLFCLLSFKRISLVGIVVSFLFWFFLRNKKDKIQNKPVRFSLLMVAVNFIFIMLCFQLVSGRYDEFISQYLGISTNQLLMGRYQLYKSVMLLFGDIHLLGIGFGKTVDVLIKNDFPLKNFHSDILKNFLELGPILFFIWIFYFYYNNVMNFKLLVIAVYLNMLFLSDNVFIYFEVMFLFYLLGMIYVLEPKITGNLKKNRG